MRDFFISIYYGIAVPILFEVQNLIVSGGFSLTKENIVEKLGMLVVSAVLAHIIRKGSNKTKMIQVTHLRASNEEEETLTDTDPVKTLPPPLGDPTHPVRP